MNCRLFSQHENYTTESQIVKLIFRIKINYVTVQPSGELLLQERVLQTDIRVKRYTMHA